MGHIFSAIVSFGKLERQVAKPERVLRTQMCGRGHRSDSHMSNKSKFLEYSAAEMREKNNWKISREIIQ